MDIGTAKPSADMRNEVPHHVIDIVEPSEAFSVARYVELAGTAIEDVGRRSKPVFVVGGTPLYLKALTEGLFEGPGADSAIRERLSAEEKAEGTGMCPRNDRPRTIPGEYEWEHGHRPPQNPPLTTVCSWEPAARNIEKGNALDPETT